MFGLDFLKKLKPAVFRYNKDVPDKSLHNEKLYFGFMAQDIESLLPKEKYSIVKEVNSGYYMVDYTQLIAPLVKSVQELTEKVEKLEHQIKTMEKK